MSRCVKDLRELICISRLSIRHDENSEDETDDDDSSQFVALSRHRVPNLNSSSDLCENILQYKSSGFSQASASGHSVSLLLKKRSKDVVVGRPKSAVGGVRRPTIERCLENQNTPLVDSCTNSKSKNNEKLICVDGLIENILGFIDASVISDWLQRSSHELDVIANWLKQGHNFVEFANFMLTQFHYTKRKELVDMEVSFILSEFELAFKVGINDKNVRIQDLQTLLKVVLAEYPARLHGRKGSYILLKILLTFCCGKNEAYRRLLSDVKFSTSNKQYIQWLLAMRAFSLINLSNGMIDFYKQLTSLENHKRSRVPIEVNDCGEDLVLLWLTDAIELDFVDVFKCFVEFFMETFASFSGNQKKIIISKAITAGSDLILKYLIEKVSSLAFGKIESQLQRIVFLVLLFLRKKHKIM